jgi:hypothetical protein
MRVFPVSGNRHFLIAIAAEIIPRNDLDLGGNRRRQEAFLARPRGTESPDGTQVTFH